MEYSKMKSEKSKLRKNPFIPIYLYGFFVFIISSLPTGKIQELQEKHTLFEILFSGKLMHFVMYGLFTVVLSLSFVTVFYRRKQVNGEGSIKQREMVKGERLRGDKTVRRKA